MAYTNSYYGQAYFQDYDRGLGNQLQNLYCHKLSHVTRAQFR